MKPTYLLITLILIFLSYYAVCPDSVATFQDELENIEPSSDRILQSSAVGDVSLPPNSFKISNLFQINYEFSPPGFITMAIRFNKPGQFFGIGFGPGMVGADIWSFELINGQVVVNDRHAVGHYLPPKDTERGGRNNVVRLGYQITGSYTLVKVRRALNTGDPNDVVISRGPTPGIWATTNSPTIAYHGKTKGRTVFPFK